MGQSASNTKLPVGVLRWTDQLARIAPIRRDYLQGEIQLAKRSLGRVNRKAKDLEEQLSKAVIKYGKKSDHKNLQKPRSQLRYAAKDQKYWSNRIDQLEASLATIEDDQQLMFDQVRVYLQGSQPQKRCGAIKLSVDSYDNLRVFFHKNGNDAFEGVYDGKFIIGPGGAVHYTHLR